MTLPPSDFQALDRRCIELIPPRANTLDALAIETLLGSLGVESAFTLEVAGDERGRHFLIRAAGNQIEYLKAQLQAAYDQLAFREISLKQDPARTEEKGVRVTAQLRMTALMFILAFCLCGGLQLFFLTHQGLSPALVGWGVLGVGILAVCVAVMWFLLQQQHVDPKLVQQKISLPAYDVALRLVAYAETQERAEMRLQQLASAYRQFNLSSGNAFVLKRKEFDPRDLSVGFHTRWQALFGYAMRLNTAELASLWHLPYGDGAPLVERTLTKRLLPVRDQVAEGVLIGQAVHQGENIPVHLAPDVFNRHMLLVAKTQKGKSTLMGNLAAAAMRDTDRALTVIDPHGDLVHSLLGRVPEGRVGDVMVLDFGDPHLAPGLNLLDVSQGRTRDMIVSNFIHVGELIWQDYWGPRMEDALRMALLTLLSANEKLFPQGERQFTLLDIPALFQEPNFRDTLLTRFVTDPEILRWWVKYFDPLYDSLKLDIVNPVMTKIHRFSTHQRIRSIVGQSSSTLDWRALLEKRRILLVNTASGLIGLDAAGLLGAMLLDQLNFAVREQSAIPVPARRARGTILVDEFQAIPGVDYKALLAELQKMGANFVLATQTLRQLDALDRALAGTVLANVDSLFVFQVSAEDARVLARELDEAVDAVDIINQPGYSCYLKTQRGRERLPVMHVELAPPGEGKPAIAEKVMQNVLRYARPLEQIEAERRAFMAQWYGSGAVRLQPDATEETTAEEPLFEESASKRAGAPLDRANERRRRMRTHWSKQGGGRAASPS